MPDSEYLTFYIEYILYMCEKSHAPNGIRHLLPSCHYTKPSTTLSGWLVGWRMGGRINGQTGGLAWPADNGVVARWRWWFWFRIWCWWLVMHVLEFSQFHLNTYIYSNGKQETCIQIYAYLYKVYVASSSRVIASHPQGMRWVIHVARFFVFVYVSF